MSKAQDDILKRLVLSTTECIQFIVMEEWLKQKIFTYKKVEAWFSDLLCVRALWLIADALSSPVQSSNFQSAPWVVSCNQVMACWFDYMTCILCHYHAGSRCDRVYFQQAACQKVFVALKMLVIQLWWAISDTEFRANFPTGTIKYIFYLIQCDPVKLPAYDPQLPSES